MVVEVALALKDLLGLDDRCVYFRCACFLWSCHYSQLHNQTKLILTG